MSPYQIRVDRELADRIKAARPETTIPRLVEVLLRRELERQRPAEVQREPVTA